MAATEKIVIYLYTVVLKSKDTVPVHAMSYQQDGSWWHFDDTEGTVLSIRHELIDYVQRGDAASTQEVEAL